MALIGGLVGGVVALCAIVALVVCLFVRKGSDAGAKQDIEISAVPEMESAREDSIYDTVPTFNTHDSSASSVRTASEYSDILIPASSASGEYSALPSAVSNSIRAPSSASNEYNSLPNQAVRYESGEIEQF